MNGRFCTYLLFSKYLRHLLKFIIKLFCTSFVNLITLQHIYSWSSEPVTEVVYLKHCKRVITTTINGRKHNTNGRKKINIPGTSAFFDWTPNFNAKLINAMSTERYRLYVHNMNPPVGYRTAVSVDFTYYFLFCSYRINFPSTPPPTLKSQKKF